MPADCHGKGGMTEHRCINRELERLRAIGAVFGFPMGQEWALISVLAITLAMVVSCGTCPPFPSITSLAQQHNRWKQPVPTDRQWQGLPARLRGELERFVSRDDVREQSPTGRDHHSVGNRGAARPLSLVGSGVTSTTSCSGKTSNAVSFTTQTVIM